MGKRNEWKLERELKRATERIGQQRKQERKAEKDSRGRNAEGGPRAGSIFALRYVVARLISRVASPTLPCKTEREGTVWRKEIERRRHARKHERRRRREREKKEELGEPKSARLLRERHRFRGKTTTTVFLYEQRAAERVRDKKNSAGCFK